LKVFTDSPTQTYFLLKLSLIWPPRPLYPYLCTFPRPSVFHNMCSYSLFRNKTDPGPSND
jgi:hypothetical protein